MFKPKHLIYFAVGIAALSIALDIYLIINAPS